MILSLVAILAVLTQAGADPAPAPAPAPLDSTPPLQASAPRISATLEPDSITIGDPFTLTLIVQTGDEDQVAFPVLPDTGAITALGPRREQVDQGGGRRLAVYRLAAWQTGSLRLPPAQVIITNAGVESSIPLPDVTVQVISVLPAEADPDTLAYRPVRDVLGANWSVAEKLTGGVVALALLIGLGLYLRRRNAAAHVIVAPPPRPPRERALESLQWLETSGLIESGEFKAFYSALAQILREFVAESYPPWSLDLTSAELLATVRAAEMDDREAEALRQLLNEADLVKFARRRTPRGRAAQALGATRRWVTDFVPPPVLQEAATVEELELELEPSAEGEAQDEVTEPPVSEEADQDGEVDPQPQLEVDGDDPSEEVRRQSTHDV